MPITQVGRADPIMADEPIRFDTTMTKLNHLKPAFKANGSVTAGNSAGLNDGASALLLTTTAHAKALGIQPLAEIIGYSETGIDPKIMGYARTLQ